MSVIHEALKRTPDPGPKKAPPSGVRPGKAARPSLSAWTVMWIAVFIAMASLYFREVQSRQKTQVKLRTALLALNDARTEALDARTLTAKKQQLEYENFEKENKVSKLSKQLHEVEMDKLQLLDENKILKKRISALSATEAAQPKA